MTTNIDTFFAGTPLDLVDEDAVRRWVRWMHDEHGYLSKTIRNRHSVLSAAFKAAVRAGKMNRNPAEGARIPRTLDALEHIYPTRWEFERLLKCVDPDYRTFVNALAATGMRFGELTALQVKHIDFETFSIHVRQAWKAGSKAVLGPPETPKSRRTLGAPQDLFRLLRVESFARTRDEFVFTNKAANPSSAPPSTATPGNRPAYASPATAPTASSTPPPGARRWSSSRRAPASVRALRRRRARVRDGREPAADWWAHQRVQRSASPYHRLMKRTLPLVVVPLLALGACGGSSSSTVTKTVTTSVSASPSPAMEGDESTTSEAASSAATDDGASGSEGEAGAPLAFGDTFTSPTGRKITLSALQPYTPSDTAALDEEAPKGSVYRKFKITLDNSSKETFDASEISLSTTSGERSVSTIVDGDVGSSPYVKVLPGRKLSWTVAYAVTPGDKLTVEVSTMSGTVATWDGTVK